MAVLILLSASTADQARAAPPAIRTDADRFHPRGDTFCFAFYSTTPKDSAYVIERGATALGPYYGDQADPLARASAAQAPFIYTVALPCMAGHNWDKSPHPARSTVVREVERIVSAVRDNPRIIMWAIAPEELRGWMPDELHYLEWVTTSIRSADPHRRPIFMYEPNHRTARFLETTLAFQDVCAKGAYVDACGHRNNRIWARWSMEQVLEAVANTHVRAVQPFAVLEMFTNAPAGQQNLIATRCRHDAYLPLALGAKGILVWSGFRGREGFQRDFQAYLDGYLSVASDLNGPLGLAPVFLRGKELKSPRMTLKSGPKWLELRQGENVQRYSPITWTLREHGGAVYLLAVNSAEAALQVSFAGLPLLPWQSLFEQGVRGAGAGLLSMELPPLGVKCWRFSPPARSGR